MSLLSDLHSPVAATLLAQADPLTCKVGATLAVVLATGGLMAALVSVMKDFPWQRRTVGVVEPRLEEALNAVEQLLERDLGHELRGAVRAELKAPMENLRRSGFHTTVWASVGSALLGVLGAELVRWLT